MTQPTRQDEIDLFNRLREDRKKDPRAHAATYRMGLLFEEMGIPLKRGYYILDKWSGKRWWDYGVNAAGGWFTDKAPERLPLKPPHD